MFRIGQRVVCICDDWEWCSEGEISPKVGEIYTVRDTEINPHDGLQYIYLEEIRNQPRRYEDDPEISECCFYSGDFRPVDEQFGHDVCEKIAEQAEQETIIQVK